MRSPTVCRYCGGKIVKTNSRVLYGKGNQTIYLCTMCNAYAGCYAGTDKPMGKVANPVLSSDPQFKAPKWCPRRITPPVCRIYGFADEQSQAMDALIRENFQPKRDRYIFPTPGHYRLQSEKRLNMNAKAFYNAAINGAVYDILSEDDIALGAVIEIDDGLKPYHFYYWGWSTVVPMFSFDRSQVQQQQL